VVLSTLCKAEMDVELVPREPGNREFTECDNFVPKIQPSWYNSTQEMQWPCPKFMNSAKKNNRDTNTALNSGAFLQNQEWELWKPKISEPDPPNYTLKNTHFFDTECRPKPLTHQEPQVRSSQNRRSRTWNRRSSRHIPADQIRKESLGRRVEWTCRLQFL